MSVAQALPRWDMEVVYPGLDSPPFEAAMQSAVQGIDDLGALLDRHHIDKQEAVLVDDETVRVFGEIIERYNALLDHLFTLRAYVYSFVSTDTRDALAQARLSELQKELVRLVQLGTRFTAWIGSLDVDTLIERSAVARDHDFMLRKAKIQAEHLMSPGEEALAIELGLTGGTAWSKLHGNVTSQLMVPVPSEGGLQELPMSVVRNMAMDPDREVRRRAYDAELGAWERVAVPLAAALNSIKGETNTLDDRRAWESALDLALFNNNIDRQTLDAMMDAANASFPDFRRYLKTKARALDVGVMAWYDLFAPVGESTQQWTFDEATAFMLEQFGTYSPRLRGLASRALEEHWIDAEPREGKVDGAYCMHLRSDESRVLANYVSSYDGMSTLAHELGHAYHNHCLAGRTILQQATPNTLAETASIFCQTIVKEAAIQRADREEQIAILEAGLQDNCQVTVDISSRFRFEQRLFERRRQRELSVDELNELMLETQRETYGDGLDESALHPYMWAVKGHYYSSERPFYNFPYMFGLLFGLGLYAQYRADPERFTAGYDELLSSTGMADAVTLAGRFGIDLHTPDFWNASLGIVRQDIDRLEELIDGKA